MHIANHFKFGDLVCLVVDDDKDKGMVTGILIAMSNSISYEVTWNTGGASTHFKQELELLQSVIDDAVLSQ